jgi:hypothetical protein
MVFIRHIVGVLNILRTWRGFLSHLKYVKVALVVIKLLSLNYGSEMEIMGYALVVEQKG